MLFNQTFDQTVEEFKESDWQNTFLALKAHIADPNFDLILKKSFGLEKDEMFISSLFEKYNFNKDYLTWLSLLDGGCYQFNSGRLEDGTQVT